MAYRESPYTGPLVRHIECEWSLYVESGQVVFPDNYSDIFFTESGEVYVSGIMDVPRTFEFCYGRHLRGLRLKAGSIPILLGLPASELLNQVIPLFQIKSPQVKRLYKWARSAESVDRLKQQIVRCLEDACSTISPDARLNTALTRIDSAPLRVVSSSIGLTERQTHRLFLNGMGLSPSKVKRIRRMQRTLDSMRGAASGSSLSDMAVAQGYFDQAHMSHDLKRLAGLTPTDLQRLLMAP